MRMLTCPSCLYFMRKHHQFSGWYMLFAVDLSTKLVDSTGMSSRQCASTRLVWCLSNGLPMVNATIPGYST